MSNHAAADLDISIVIPVYRDAARAIALVQALLRCLPKNLRSEIIVVDDGSGDDTATRIERATGATASVHALATNVGRAAVRNAGAQLARGDRILFMDCDCLPASDDLVAEHLRVWHGDVVASIGPVVGDGQGFWSRYQAAASARRERQHRDGVFFSGSSQNLMVSRARFEACGGFDARYRTYGFEDRDLQLRLGRDGRVAWAARAVVQHMDTLDLPTICHKMIEAGGPASVLFSKHHPEAYEALGYAALDARQHRWLRFPPRLLARLIMPMAHCGDRLIASSLVPYGLKSLLVRTLTGLSYLVGTARYGPAGVSEVRRNT